MQFPVQEYTRETHEIVDTGANPDVLFTMPWDGFCFVELTGATSLSGNQRQTGDCFYMQSGSDASDRATNIEVIVARMEATTDPTDGAKLVHNTAYIPAGETIYMDMAETGDARFLVFHLWRVPSTL